MKLLLLCFLYLLLAFHCKAQEEYDLPQRLDDLLIDQRVSILLNKHIDYNTLRKGVDGYRVQIFFDSGNTSREDAFEVRSTIIKEHPHLNAYVIWQQPYYKVRVGDFLTKLEAQGLLEQLKTQYKNAFVVKDIIDYKLTENTTTE